jgi:hypothetical protein
MERSDMLASTIDAVERTYLSGIDDTAMQMLGSQPGIEDAIERWQRFGTLEA